MPDIARWYELPADGGRIAALVAFEPFSIVLQPADSMEERVREWGLRPMRIRGNYMYRAPVALVDRVARLHPGLPALLREHRPWWADWFAAERQRQRVRKQAELTLAELSGVDALPLRIDLASRVARLREIPTFANLYDYQQAGVLWLDLAGGLAILGDDMGVGKTPQALVYLSSLVGPQRALIVCPTSVAYNWQDEAVKWAPDWTVRVPKNTRELRKGIASGPQAEREAWVVTWGSLRLTHETLREAGFDTVIADEAHYAKEVSAQRTQVLAEIAHLAAHRLLLTGTYVRNRPRELWSLLHIVDPQSFPVFVTFGEDFCGARDRYTAFGVKVRIYQGSARLAKLNVLTRSYILRRTKIQVLPQLPDKTVRKLRIAMPGGKFKRDYLEVMERIRNNAKTGDDPAALGALQALRKEVGLAKVDAAVELIENLVTAGEQVVVFLFHKDVRATLEEKLDALGISHRAIVGDTPKRKRRDLRVSFQAHEYDVLIGSEACKEGVTLTAARHVVRLQRWWTPGDEDQADDRVCRIGQTRGVLISVLHLCESLDDVVDEILAAKAATIEKIEDRTAIDRQVLRRILKAT